MPHLTLPLAVPFCCLFPNDILHFILYISCVTGIDAKCLALDRAAQISLDIYQTNPQLIYLARIFEVDGVDPAHADHVVNLLHLFVDNFNLCMLKIIDIDFRTSLLLLVLKIAHLFDVLAIDNCIFDDLHILYLLNSVPSLCGLHIGQHHLSIICQWRHVLYSPHMFQRALIEGVSSLDSMTYCAENVAHEAGDYPNMLSFFYALLDSDSFMDISTFHLCHLHSLTLLVKHYSHDSAQVLLVASGSNLLSLEFTYIYGAYGSVCHLQNSWNIIQITVVKRMLG
ncbi:hypothetical protein EDD85DRAFT_946566 [Armillaria nabsnona]|nr:hypothetical protein EDD85DRAFT_946566 [Armillaria nabsnona]